MSKSYRRCEILLPLKFNDGRPVPDEAIGSTLLELRERFGAVSVETQTTEGTWTHLGQVYRDDLVRVYVDVAASRDEGEFFAAYKEQLKQRLGQLDIWITTYPIEVI